MRILLLDVLLLLFYYHPKPSKSWIIVKPQYLDEAKRMFPDLNITDSGRKYLGSFIGTEEGKEKYVEEKIEEWATDIEELSEIASREPQVAYAAYIYIWPIKKVELCMSHYSTDFPPIEKAGI